MSRIGKKPVAIPSGVTANIENGTLTVKGPKGTLSLGLSDLIDYKVEGEAIQVNPAVDSRAARAFWGMQRTLVSNLVEGVTAGFTRVLNITGVGYRVLEAGSAEEALESFKNPLHPIDLAIVDLAYESEGSGHLTISIN